MYSLLYIGFMLVPASCSSMTGQRSPDLSLPDKAEVLSDLRLANDFFMVQYPNPGEAIVTDRARPSNIWTRGTYYEGLMALYEIDPMKRYYDYAVEWVQFHNWGLRGGNRNRNADDQCCGQTYIDLYKIDTQPERIANIKANIDFIVSLTYNGTVLIFNI